MTTSTDAAERTITLTRTFGAPRALVYRMWTEANHVAWWWGPTGFSTTIYEMDVRPGGHWRFTMHGPDGTDYPNEIIYRVVDPPQRLAYAHVVPPFEMDVLFAEDGAHTRVTATLTFPTAAERNAAGGRYGATEGLRQTLGRLGGHVDALTASAGSEPAIVAVRDFAAPRELVFRAHTDPAMMQRWWGPHGYENATCEIDLRVGGSWRVEQRTREGARHVFGGTYREIVAPERLVATWVWDGKPDEELLVITTLEDAGDGVTRLRSATILPSIAARDAMLGYGAVGGMNQSFERLDALLAEPGPAYR